MWLGYSENDFQQQYYMKVGNHNFALIPDFVVMPVSNKGHYSAPIIIEAKLSISTPSELQETKVQTRSYAKLLGTKYAVIVSKDKIWTTTKFDDYEEVVFEH